MTSSGKVRIYELSRDLGLDNKDVLDAAEKLSIAVRSHSSSISDDLRTPRFDVNSHSYVKKHDVTRSKLGIM